MCSDPLLDPLDSLQTFRRRSPDARLLHHQPSNPRCGIRFESLDVAVSARRRVCGVLVVGGDEDRVGRIGLPGLAPDLECLRCPQRQEQHRRAVGRPHRVSPGNIDAHCRQRARRGPGYFIRERVPARGHPGVVTQLAKEGLSLVDIPRPEVLHCNIGHADYARTGRGDAIAGLVRVACSTNHAPPPTRDPASAERSLVPIDGRSVQDTLDLFASAANGKWIRSSWCWSWPPWSAPAGQRHPRHAWGYPRICFA